MAITRSTNLMHALTSAGTSPKMSTIYKEEHQFFFLCLCFGEMELRGDDQKTRDVDATRHSHGNNSSHTRDNTELNKMTTNTSTTSSTTKTTTKTTMNAEKKIFATQFFLFFDRIYNFFFKYLMEKQENRVFRSLKKSKSILKNKIHKIRFVWNFWRIFN